MSGNLVKIYDSLYVGIRPKDKKGYMTYFDKNDSSFKSRKRSIDNWKTSEGTAEFIDNEPQEGFEIIDYTSRYSTSNKLFKVKDPRGFILELSAEDLIDVIKANQIIYGKIQGKLVWARKGGGNFLVRADSELCKIAREYATSEISIKDISPGDVILTSTGENLVYIGRKYVLSCKAHKLWGRVSPSVPSFANRAYHTIHEFEYEFFSDSYHCFISKEDTTNLYLYKSLKIVAVRGSEPVNIDDKGYFKSYNSLKGLNSGSYILCPNTARNIGIYNYRLKLFDTKAELESYDRQSMIDYIQSGLDKEKESKDKDENPRYYFD